MSYPTTPKFATINLKSSHSTLSSIAQSGRRQVRSLGGHSWAFTAKYDRLTRAEFMPVYAFAISQRGQFGSFTIIPPDLATPQGVATGTPLVNGASQTGNILAIDGAAISTTGWLKAGDIFSISGDTKVYMLTADANTDGTGAVTLNFEPDLTVSPANNAAITVTNVAFTMMFSGDVQEYGAVAPLRYNFEIDLIEAL